MNSKKKYMICKDLSNNCEDLIKNDMCKKNNKIANSLCRKSCNTCKPNNIKYLINKVSTRVNENRNKELGETYLLINDEAIERDAKLKSFVNIYDGKEKYSIQERIRRELKHAENKRLGKLKNNKTKYNYNFNSSLDNYEYSEESIDEENEVDEADEIDEEIFDESSDKTYKMEQKRKWEQYLISQTQNDFNTNVITDKYHKNFDIQQLFNKEKIFIDEEEYSEENDEKKQTTTNKISDTKSSNYSSTSNSSSNQTSNYEWSSKMKNFLKNQSNQTSDSSKTSKTTNETSDSSKTSKKTNELTIKTVCKNETNGTNDIKSKDEVMDSDLIDDEYMIDEEDIINDEEELNELDTEELIDEDNVNNIKTYDNYLKIISNINKKAMSRKIRLESEYKNKTCPKRFKEPEVTDRIQLTNEEDEQDDLLTLKGFYEDEKLNIKKSNKRSTVGIKYGKQFNEEDKLEEEDEIEEVPIIEYDEGTTVTLLKESDNISDEYDSTFLFSSKNLSPVDDNEEDTDGMTFVQIMFITMAIIFGLIISRLSYSTFVKK